MSIKTLACGDTFHFYKEILDEQNVYLKLSETSEQITIAIPIHIWEVIRHFGAPDLSLIDKSDEELLAIVEKYVDERIERYNHKPSSMVNLAGVMQFGSPSDPRTDQVEKGLAAYQAWRTEQQKVKAAIDALEQRQQ